MIVLLILIICLCCVHLRKKAQKKAQIISSVTALSRGEWSERELIYELVQSCGIPANTIFHDLYVPYKGGYSQIDLVVPTSVGMFVFEVKDFGGWIFGNARNEKWTQVLAYGQEKHQFYNPLKQNEGHIAALKGVLPQLQNVPIFSVVVFYGSSEIRDVSGVPVNSFVIYPSQVNKLIKNIKTNLPPAPYVDKWEVMRVLKSAVENGANPNIVQAQRQRAKVASYGKYWSTYNYKPRFIRRFKMGSHNRRFI